MKPLHWLPATQKNLDLEQNRQLQSCKTNQQAVQIRIWAREVPPSLQHNLFDSVLFTIKYSIKKTPFLYQMVIGTTKNLVLFAILATSTYIRAQ